MWYAVETVFIDGKLFDSRCVFKEGDTSPLGHCFAGLDEEHMNRCEKKFGDRIEIHTDWFESEELAKKFRDGEITYVHTYDAYYKQSIKSTLRRFVKREIVEVSPNRGYYPCRGVYRENMLDYKPSWVS